MIRFTFQRFADTIYLFICFSKSCQLWYCIQEMLKRHPLKLKILGGKNKSSKMSVRWLLLEVTFSMEASSSDLHWWKTQCRMGWNSKSQSNQSMFWFHTFPSFTVLLSTASIMLLIAWTLMALSQSTEIFFCGEPTQKLNDRNSLKKWSKKRTKECQTCEMSRFFFHFQSRYSHFDGCPAVRASSRAERSPCMWGQAHRGWESGW